MKDLWPAGDEQAQVLDISAHWTDFSKIVQSAVPKLVAKFDTLKATEVEMSKLSEIICDMEKDPVKYGFESLPPGLTDKFGSLKNEFVRRYSFMLDGPLVKCKRHHNPKGKQPRIQPTGGGGGNEPSGI